MYLKIFFITLTLTQTFCYATNNIGLPVKHKASSPANSSSAENVNLDNDLGMQNSPQSLTKEQLEQIKKEFEKIMPRTKIDTFTIFNSTQTQEDLEVQINGDGENRGLGGEYSKLWNTCKTKNPKNPREVFFSNIPYPELMTKNELDRLKKMNHLNYKNKLSLIL